MGLGDEEGASRGSHLVEVGGDAPRRIEAGVESTVELGEVLVEAALGIAVRRIDGIDLDQRRGEQPVDVIHRRNETPTLIVVEPFEHRPREGLAAAVEHCPFCRPLLGEPCAADPSVAVARSHLDQGVSFQ